MAAVSPSRYVLSSERSFMFAAGADEVWRAISRLDRFTEWWSWLRDFRVEGSGLQSGTVLHGVIVPPLPYRLRLRVVLDECVPAQHIRASVHGDLEGVAVIALDGDHEKTCATATWTLEMMAQPMRIAARVTLPILRWGHDRVVDATVEGFRRHLNDERDG